MEQSQSGALHYEVEPITEISEGAVPELREHTHEGHEKVPLESPSLDSKSEDEKHAGHDTVKIADYEVDAETFIFDIRSGKPLPPNPDSPGE